MMLLLQNSLRIRKLQTLITVNVFYKVLEYLRMEVLDNALFLSNLIKQNKIRTTLYFKNTNLLSNSFP